MRAGSIGSELCRQIGALEPAELILYERYENSLYAIANDLADRGVSAVGAQRDRRRDGHRLERPRSSHSTGRTWSSTPPPISTFR